MNFEAKLEKKTPLGRGIETHLSSIAHYFIEIPSPSTPCGTGLQWMYFARAGSLCSLQMVYKNRKVNK